MKIIRQILYLLPAGLIFSDPVNRTGNAQTYFRQQNIASDLPKMLSAILSSESSDPCAVLFTWVLPHHKAGRLRLVKTSESLREGLCIFEQNVIFI